MWKTRRALVCGTILLALAGEAQAADARLEAIIDANGTIVRSRGVAQVTRPANLAFRGVYCIKPRRSADLNLNFIFPILTPTENAANNGPNDVIVTYHIQPTRCPLNTIEVSTSDFRVENGPIPAGFVDSDHAFVIVVN